MDPRVLEAMADAARAYVPISELHQAVGKRIASLTGAEAAMVSSGAASIVLGTAACIAGTDRERILRLPDTTGMKNQVLIPVTPGLSWTRYARSAGGVLVQFTDASDLKLKISGESAMILYIPALHAET